MAVNITWSATENGTQISDPLDHGQKENGEITDVESIFLRHDGANQITNARMYIDEKSGVYGGDFAAATDLAEIIGWGDGGVADAFGGFQINMDANGGFPNGSWPTVGTKQPSNGSAFFTGVGDSAVNGVTLTTAMGAGVTSNGIIAAAATDVNFSARVEIPFDEDTSGIRQFDSKLRFTFTS